MFSFRTIQPPKSAYLSGSSVPKAQWVIEQRTGKWNEPYAMRMMLEWALMGPMSCRTNPAFDVHTLQLQDIQRDIGRYIMGFVDSASGKE
ncbi:hypothetical protein PHET_09502 [Paragonimus heterotremus]|uniref:Uncharacterized protein n=1 Tax=Paragonimus heterotremus TaxID=100268 RepID=A0A8J4WEQ3_9TREM|nr:hypothetical protein PHET_09502 [Paragonimus heterotremus]